MSQRSLQVFSELNVPLDMLRRMRTTINLPDELILRAKKAAVNANTTLTEVIANALRCGNRDMAVGVKECRVYGASVIRIV